MENLTKGRLPEPDLQVLYSAVYACQGQTLQLISAITWVTKIKGFITRTLGHHLHLITLAFYLPSPLQFSLPSHVFQNVSPFSQNISRVKHSSLFVRSVTDAAEKTFYDGATKVDKFTSLQRTVNTKVI